MSLGRILLALIALTSICGEALCGDAADELNLTDSTEKNTPAETHAGGAVLVRLVSVSNPNETLADKVFWRRFQNHIAAQTTPVKFKLDGAVVIGPCPGVVKETKEATTLFPSEGRIDLPNGDHTLIPGKAIITVKGGALSSAHPAIKISDQTVNVLCAPVRLEVVSDGGAPVPTAINVSWETEPLLREQAQFGPLIIWLPVGLKYASTLGVFSISADGKVSAQPADLAANVAVTSDGPMAPFDGGCRSIEEGRFRITSTIRGGICT